MSAHRKLYRYRVDKEDAEKQRLKLDMHLPGVGNVSIGVAELSEAYISLTGCQALALLRLLERNRATLEQEAEAEREREYGRGPGPILAEVPQKIRRGDPRIREASYHVWSPEA